MPWNAPETNGVQYLADPKRLARKLGVEATDEDMLDALERASDRFRGAVRHPVHLVKDDTVTLNGPGRGPLVLPAAPVVGDIVLEIRTNTGTITHTTLGENFTTQYGVDRNAGIVERAGSWPTGLGAIRVTYSHGHEVIPGDICDAVLEVAETTYTIEHGIAQISTGNESASYSLAEATGVTQRWTDAVENHQLNNGDRQ